MMGGYIRWFQKLPDVEEIMLYREHFRKLTSIREAALDASKVAMETVDPTLAISRIGHHEVVETQRENRRFAARLAALHEYLGQRGRVLPSLDEASEFLAEPRYADRDNGIESSRSIDELLANNFSGMAAQLQDYLGETI